MGGGDAGSLTWCTCAVIWKNTSLLQSGLNHHHHPQLPVLFKGDWFISVAQFCWPWRVASLRWLHVSMQVAAQAVLAAGESDAYERLAVAMALAESTHHSAPRGQKKARAGERVQVHGQVPDEPPPQEPGTQYFELADDDSVPELRSRGAEAAGADWAAHGGRLRAGARPRGAAAGREPDEKVVDIPVCAGLKRLRDLQGTLPGQGSTAPSRDAPQGFPRTGFTSDFSSRSSRSCPRTGFTSDCS